MKSSLAVLVVLAVFAGSTLAQEAERRASWSVPLTADVKAKLDDYAAAKQEVDQIMSELDVL